MRFLQKAGLLAPVLGLMSVAGCGGSSGGPVGETGAVIFASDRDGNSEIYLMAPNGTGQTRVTDNPSTDTRPNLRGDRGQIVFESARGLVEEVKAPSSRITPRHAPAAANIWLIDAGGANPEASARRITSSDADFAPVFNPSGTRITFRSERDGNSEIYIMNADGTAQTRLTNDTADDRDPDFNNNGARIVFASNRGNIAAVYDLWSMNADGSGLTRLTSGAGTNLGPAFSPDGARIAFWSTRGGSSDLWLMNADGTGVQRLTSEAGNERFPAWSPDGSSLVFYSNRSGGDEIWKLDIASGAQTQLTNNAAEEDFPDWR